MSPETARKPRVSRPVALGRRRGRTLVLSVWLVVALGACSDEDELPESRRRCDLGRSNDQGVAGHDLAASTRLPDGRVLFVFGDTYLGSVDGDVRRSTGLVNSSGALLPERADICSRSLTYLTDGDDRVRALLPDPEVRGTAFWPVDVTVVGEKVWMLYRWVERIGDGALELRVRGTGLAVADSSELEFEPASDLLVKGPRPLPTALGSRDDELLGLVCEGTRRDDRCRLRTIDTDSTEIGDPRPEPSLELAAPEMSVAEVELDGRRRWRVSSMPGLSCVLRIAVRVDDRWEQRTVLEPDVEGRLCYAGRVQEAFSTEARLVVTWVDTAKRRSDADRYWPHVEVIDLR